MDAIVTAPICQIQLIDEHGVWPKFSSTHWTSHCVCVVCICVYVNKFANWFEITVKLTFPECRLAKLKHENNEIISRWWDSRKNNSKNNTNEISFMRTFNTIWPEESEYEEEEECHLNILNIFYSQWHSIFSKATIFISKKKKKRVRACNELTEREFTEKWERKKTCSAKNMYRRKVIRVMGDTQSGNENDRV